jgi:protein O-GlcNAc transferase
VEYILSLIQQQKYSGNYDKAISISEMALKSYPDNIDLLYNSALLYADIGFFKSSISLYKKILELNPTHKDSLFDLAAVLFQSGKWEDAMQVSDELVKIDPHYKKISMHTANALSHMGRWEESMERYKVHIQSNNTGISDWSDMLLSMNYIEMKREDRFSHYEELFKSLQNPTPKVNKEVKDKINIGYVSSDFSNHAVSYFTKGVIPNHNKEKFNVIFYHNGFVKDDITQLFKEGGTLKKVLHLTDEQFFDEIVSDNIHVLVDLNGHTRNNRLQVFAMRPSPIQISWLGFLNTIGVPAIEHKIVHPQMKIDGKYYTEKIHSVYDSLFYTPPNNSPEISEQPFKLNGYITYGCFNNPRKITDKTISVWDEILNINRTSKLKLLTTGDLDYDEIVRQKFSTENRKRISFENECSTIDFMKLISSVDLCLDPFPHSGGATTAHSLWMGVPVISLRGDTEFQNISSSILSDVGMNEFICKTIDEYVEKILNVDPLKLESIRKTIRDGFKKDPSKTVIGLESLYVKLLSSL